PMQLFLQVNLQDIPLKLAEWPERGFLQVFYCTTKKTYCEEKGADAFQPFGKFVSSRVLDRHDKAEFTNTSPVENPFPPKPITGWQSQEDYPAPAELEHVAPGVLSDDEAMKLFLTIEKSRSGFSKEAPTTICKDKLGGWPMWIQGASYPTCPQCNAVMEFVAQ